MIQLSHLYYWKNHSFDYMDLCQQSDDYECNKNVCDSSYCDVHFITVVWN